MTKFKLLLSIFILSLLSCNKDCDSNSACLTLSKHEFWKTQNLKPNIFIQFPETYEGQGMVLFEGYTFQKQSADQSVKFHYSYCGPLYCEQFGGELTSPGQTSFTTFDQNGTSIVLNQKLEFCKNGQTLAYFYHNSDLLSTGIYFMKRDNGFYESVSVDFKKSKLSEVIEILKTVTPIECNYDIFCTEVFVSIGIKIQNSNGNTVNLKKVVVTFDNSGKETNITQNQFGVYTIVTDNDIIYMSKNGTYIAVKGYGDLSNQLIFSEKYTIGHDCCHVIKFDGKDIIVIP